MASAGPPCEKSTFLFGHRRIALLSSVLDRNIVVLKADFCFGPISCLRQSGASENGAIKFWIAPRQLIVRRLGEELWEVIERRSLNLSGEVSHCPNLLRNLSSPASAIASATFESLI